MAEACYICNGVMCSTWSHLVYLRAKRKTYNGHGWRWWAMHVATITCNVVEKRMEEERADEEERRQHARIVAEFGPTG